MKKLLLALICLFAAGFFADVNAQAQKPAPAYKITAIRILPFDQMSGEFGEPLSTTEQPYFLNALDKTFFVTIEISGQKDSFEALRKVQITVTEGKKLKTQKSLGVGYIGENGKVYMPLFLADTYCSEVTITAKLTGQKTPSQMSRKIGFDCGE